MRLPNNTRIAGRQTVADWLTMKDQLVKSSDSRVWGGAFAEFFESRIETRYFAPIGALEDMRVNKGEGFAIVALYCSLVEFLASALEGKRYRYQRNGQPPLAEFEYSGSRAMFIGFLESYDPFKAMFSVPGTAADFYASVRCGLLHEARTKSGWRIKISQLPTPAVDVVAKIVYRNEMPTAFIQFMNWYGNALLQNADLQKAFIRKMDSLCEE